jgi:hypothetical protein
MDALKNFFSRKQTALNKTHRPGYPIPQYMSSEDERRIEYARDDLRRAHTLEMAKPVSQRNTELLWKMDIALNPRLI